MQASIAPGLYRIPDYEIRKTLAKPTAPETMVDKINEAQCQCHVAGMTTFLSPLLDDLIIRNDRNLDIG